MPEPGRSREPARDDAGRTWHLGGAEEVVPGVHRIPLSLPMDGLKAVNAYAVRSPDRFVLIDAGWAIAQAEAELVDGLSTFGAGLEDVTDFVVTHAHRDHYTMAAALRRRFGARVLLGEGERPTMEWLAAPPVGGQMAQVELLLRAGAPELSAVIGSLTGDLDRSHWALPDHWVGDGEVLPVGEDALVAIHTPGHTRGHVAFHDAGRRLLFGGDHVLPHITPSIGFEQAVPRSPLRDYLTSLHLLRTMPDARLLPGHGPVGPSVHERVDELLAHHDHRLEQTLAAVRKGAGTAYEVARCLTWTGRERRLGDLDDFNAMLAVLETLWHLEVLAERNLVRRGEDGQVLTFA